MSMPGATELIIIAVVLVLLFGAKKLPEMARGIGRSLRILKSETAKLRDDDDETKTAQPTVQATVQPQQPPAAPPQIPAPPAASVEEQARRLEEQAAQLRASARQGDKQV